MAFNLLIFYGVPLLRRDSLLILLLLFFFYSHCAVDAAAQGKPLSFSTSGDRKVLRIGLNATAVETLDPHMAAAFHDRLVVDMIFNGLLRYKPGNTPHLEPDLAENIPVPYIRKGRQIWTFRLKHGVMFHSGPASEAYELTADDVVYSFRRASDPTRSRYAGEYQGMTVEKVDDYTCNIIMSPPLSPVLFFSKVADYAGGFIVPKRALEAMGDVRFREHPVGTGPFSYADHQLSNSLILKANPDYFRGRPKLDEVKVTFFPEEGEYYRAFNNGDVDLIQAGDEIRSWLNFPNETIVDIFGVPEVALIHFNTSFAPLNDIRVRKAIAYALDRKRFLAPFNQLTTTSICSPIPETYLPGGLPEDQVKALGLDYPTNLEKSRALLAEAGFPNGFTLDVVATKLKHMLKDYLSLKSQLARVGIHIKLKIVDHSTMHRLVRQNKSALVIYMAWRPNTDVFLSRFFHSDSIVVSGKHPGTNFSHYRDIDKLIVLARKEMDPQKQIRLWEYAQIKILEDMVSYPLHYRKRIYLRRGYVDYGHPLISTMSLYPQITEKTRVLR